MQGLAGLVLENIDHEVFRTSTRSSEYAVTSRITDTAVGACCVYIVGENSRILFRVGDGGAFRGACYITRRFHRSCMAVYKTFMYIERYGHPHCIVIIIVHTAGLSLQYFGLHMHSYDMAVLSCTLLYSPRLLL